MAHLIFHVFGVSANNREPCFVCTDWTARLAHVVRSRPSLSGAAILNRCRGGGRCCLRCARRCEPVDAAEDVLDVNALLLHFIFVFNAGTQRFKIFASAIWWDETTRAHFAILAIISMCGPEQPRKSKRQCCCNYRCRPCCCYQGPRQTARRQL